MNATLQAQPETDRPATPERANTYQLPPVNLRETDDGYTIEADVPGVARDSVEIYLDRNELTLLGRRQSPRPGPGVVQYRESAPGDYRRVFELHPGIDPDRITAQVENGVLTVHLAKREGVKPRRIAVAD